MENNMLIKKEKGYVLINEVQPIASTLSPNRGSKLSLKNCQEIELGYDLDKLSENHAEEVYVRNENDYNELANFENRKSNFDEGFNKAMELNKDKLFTIEDIELAMETMMGQEVFYGKTHEETQQMRYEYIKRFISYLIKQPTEIEVEVEMEKIPDGLDESCHIQYVKVPKLDVYGCLILKKL